jgi:hypothetical protein
MLFTLLLVLGAIKLAVKVADSFDKKKPAVSRSTHYKDE